MPISRLERRSSARRLDRWADPGARPRGSAAGQGPRWLAMNRLDLVRGGSGCNPNHRARDQDGAAEFEEK